MFENNMPKLLHKIGHTALINIIILFFVLPTALTMHKLNHGYIENYILYFLATAFFVTIIPPIFDSSWKTGIIKSILSVFFILIFAHAFWGYKDKPYLLRYDYWFNKTEFHSRFNSKTCDGSCFGWFSFENELETNRIIKYGTLGLAFGIVIKFIATRTKKAPTKNSRSH